MIATSRLVADSPTYDSPDFDRALRQATKKSLYAKWETARGAVDASVYTENARNGWSEYARKRNLPESIETYRHTVLLLMLHRAYSLKLEDADRDMVNQLMLSMINEQDRFSHAGTDLIDLSTLRQSIPGRNWALEAVDRNVRQAEDNFIRSLRRSLQ